MGEGEGLVEIQTGEASTDSYKLYRELPWASREVAVWESATEQRLHEEAEGTNKDGKSDHEESKC
jgi:hypothetical protein